MRFRKGDRVEVASKEDGYVGSYYPATVITELTKKNKNYTVQYKTLLKDDLSAFLREEVAADEVRPPPPAAEVPATRGFDLHDKVDVCANDGWWVGRITGRVRSSSGAYHYYVYFETTGDEIAYPFHRLRVHQEWLNGKWVAPLQKGLI